MCRIFDHTCSLHQWNDVNWSQQINVVKLYNVYLFYVKGVRVDWEVRQQRSFVNKYFHKWRTSLSTLTPLTLDLHMGTVATITSPNNVYLMTSLDVVPLMKTAGVVENSGHCTYSIGLKSLWNCLSLFHLLFLYIYTYIFIITYITSFSNYYPSHHTNVNVTYVTI